MKSLVLDSLLSRMNPRSFRRSNFASLELFMNFSKFKHKLIPIDVNLESSQFDEPHAALNKQKRMFR